MSTDMKLPGGIMVSMYTLLVIDHSVAQPRKQSNGWTQTRRVLRLFQCVLLQLRLVYLRTCVLARTCFDQGTLPKLSGCLLQASFFAVRSLDDASLV